MKVKKIFERLNECLRKGYLKAGMQHNIFAQIFATIYSLEKLRLDAEIQSHSVDFRQCELADHICVCVCFLHSAFYERRSRWYRSKSDKPPVFALAHKPIHLYERHETYPYLEHKFNVSGDWEEQVTELCHEFTRRR